MLLQLSELLYVVATAFGGKNSSNVMIYDTTRSPNRFVDESKSDRAPSLQYHIYDHYYGILHGIQHYECNVA